MIFVAKLIFKFIKHSIDLECFILLNLFAKLYSDLSKGGLSNEKNATGAVST